MKHETHQSNDRNKQLIEDLTNPETETDLFSKEVIWLASGFLFLTLGIGGILMYSEEKPLHASTTKTVDIKHVSKAFHSPTQDTPSSKEPVIQPPSAKLVSLKEESPSSEAPRLFEETDVYFGFDKTGLSEEAKTVLQAAVARLGQGQTWEANIQGHTDAKGSDSYNRALALRRAQSVKTYLMTLGAQESSIHIESLSSGSHVCTEDSEDCHQQNRRAHVILEKVEPAPIAEAPLISESVPTESEDIMIAEPTATPSISEDEGPTTMALLEPPRKVSDESDPKSSTDPLP